MKKTLLFSIFMGFIPVSQAVVVHTPPPDLPREEVSIAKPKAPAQVQRKQPTQAVQKAAVVQPKKQVVVRKSAPQAVRKQVVVRENVAPQTVRKQVVVREDVANAPVVVKKKRYVKRYMNPPRRVVQHERVIVRRPAPRVVEERVIVRRPPVVREYRYYEPRRVYHERRYYEPAYAPLPISLSLGFLFH